MQKQIPVRFTGDEELELYEFLRKESFETGLPMAEIVRQGIELYKNQKEKSNMEVKYLVKMVVGDENEFYNTAGSSLPAPKTILETTSLEEARILQSKTEYEYLDDEFNSDGKPIFLAPIVIKVVDGEETMLY